MTVPVPRARWPHTTIILAVVLMAQLMLVLDLAIVNAYTLAFGGPLIARRQGAGAALAGSSGNTTRAIEIVVTGARHT